MKFILHTFTLLFTCIALQAQNIVPNPDFSLHTDCPYQLNQLDFCSSWSSGNSSSPDYLHACATDTIVGVPNNLVGSQSSFSNAMAGIISYSSPSPVPDYREYITTTIPPLTIGMYYIVTIVISLADKCRFASEGLGVFFFHNVTLDMSISHCLSFTPQADFSSYGIISDTSNWVTLTDTMLADSSYSHLVIGSFKTDAITNFTTILNPSGSPMAYYYIDSVSVEMVQPSSIQTIDASVPVSIHPNPVKGTATFTFHHSPNTTITLYNPLGKAVKNTNIHNTDNASIDCSDLPTGIYFYRIQGADNATVQGKLMVD